MISIQSGTSRVTFSSSLIAGWWLLCTASISAQELHISKVYTLSHSLKANYENVIFDDGAALITNGYDLDITIRKNLILRGSAKIESFDVNAVPLSLRVCDRQIPVTPPEGKEGISYCGGPTCDPDQWPPNQAQGNAGGNGSPGNDGADNVCTPPKIGKVSVKVLGHVEGSVLEVRLYGVRGSPGGSGSQGGSGGSGQQGGHCNSIYQHAGDGGPGGWGGDGGNSGVAGRGGAGGPFTFILKNPNPNFSLVLSQDGGPPGIPGAVGWGGYPGPGGYLGRGGSGCWGVSNPPKPYERASAGLAGQSGSYSSAGEFGAPGAQVLQGINPTSAASECQPTQAYSDAEQFQYHVQLWSLLAPALFNSDLVGIPAADGRVRYFINVPYGDPDWLVLAAFTEWLLEAGPFPARTVPRPDPASCLANNAISTVYGRDYKCCSTAVNGPQKFIGTPHRQCLRNFGYDYVRANSASIDFNAYKNVFSLQAMILLIGDIGPYASLITFQPNSIAALPSNRIFLNFLGDKADGTWRKTGKHLLITIDPEMLSALALDLSFAYKSALSLNRGIRINTQLPTLICNAGYFYVANGPPGGFSGETLSVSPSQSPPNTIEPEVPAEFQGDPIFDKYPFAIEFGSAQLFSYLRLKPNQVSMVKAGDTSVCRFFSAMAERKDSFLECLGGANQSNLSDLQEYLSIPYNAATTFDMLYILYLLKSAEISNLQLPK